MEMIVSDSRSGSSALGSQLIAAAAQHVGAEVERLSPKVIVCSYGQRRVAFTGMAGDCL
jgi:hypothetical protein